MKRAILILAAIPLVGCARMGTKQVDRSTITRTYQLDERGRTNAVVVTEDRETTTRAGGTAVVSSSSTFEGLKATQDGKQQGLSVDKSKQTSDIDKIVDVFGKLAPLAGALAGVPVGAPAASSTPSAPPGMKWVLQPKDEPSKPQPEIP